MHIRYVIATVLLTWGLAHKEMVHGVKRDEVAYLAALYQANYEKNFAGFHHDFMLERLGGALIGAVFSAGMLSKSGINMAALGPCVVGGIVLSNFAVAKTKFWKGTVVVAEIETLKNNKMLPILTFAGTVLTACFIRKMFCR